MSKVEDMVNQKFGRLTVLHRVENKIYKNSQRSQWLCECSCENKTQIKVTRDSLKSGNTKSCSCLQTEIQKERAIDRNTTHGYGNSRIYKTLKNMKRRCYNPKCEAYENYGKRGIKVCDEWLSSVESFYNWAISNGYDDNLTIERIDVNGNYSPENCCWIPQSKQNLNRRNSINITIDNITKNLVDWAKEFNINQNTIKGRYQQGVPIEDLFKPIDKSKSRIKTSIHQTDDVSEVV